MRRTEWTSEHDFTIDGVAYRSMVGGASPDQITILKEPAGVAFYEDLIESTAPRRILELGIYGGGSVALLAQLATPEKLVALELSPGPCGPLEDFIDPRGLRDTVVPYYGTDQANAAQLDALMAAEFDGPLDLIIDDASHLVDQTRASFHRLFPHLRPGGLFVIEDWSWAHHGYPATDVHYQGVTPLSAFVCELVIAAACRPRVVAEVTATDQLVIVRRGVAKLHPERFDLAFRFDPVGREMVDRLSVVDSLGSDDPRLVSGPDPVS